MPEQAPPSRWRSSEHCADRANDRDIIGEGIKDCESTLTLQEAPATTVQRCMATSRGRHTETDFDEETKAELGQLGLKADRLRRASCDSPPGARPRLGRALWRLRLRRAKIRTAACLRAVVVERAES